MTQLDNALKIFNFKTPQDIKKKSTNFTIGLIENVKLSCN